ncbi:MAG: hypothetical protein ABI091_26530 [Ferruginibacter sp.]
MELEQYYFKTIGFEPDEDCIELCNVRNDGTMIGSANCLSCKHNVGNNLDEWGYFSWIKCDKLKEATTPNKLTI